MTYGLNPELFVEDGPAVRAASTALARNSSRFFRWRTLDSDRRFALVEQMLSAPANDLIDNFPIAF